MYREKFVPFNQIKLPHAQLVNIVRTMLLDSSQALVKVDTIVLQVKKLRIHLYVNQVPIALQVAKFLRVVQRENTHQVLELLQNHIVNLVRLVRFAHQRD